MEITLSLESNWRSETSDTIKESKNCDVLLSLQLELISKGAESDEWIKSKNDYSLEIAEKRYELLC